MHGGDGGARSHRTTGVLVVVVTYNSAAVIADCLDSLTDGLDDVPVAHVVVADNASTDDTVALAADRAGVDVLPTGGNLGYAAAINRAVQTFPDHDAVLVLNPDAELTPGCVRVLADALGRPGVGVVVPSIVGPDGTIARSLRRAPSLRQALAEAVLGGDRASRLGLGEIVADAAVYTRPGDVQWATGAALMVSGDCARALGAWDETFLLYSEETDYMLRAADRGFAVRYVPAAAVRHRGGELGTSAFLWSLLMANKVRLYRKRHGRATAFVYRVVLLFGEVLRAARGTQRSRAAVRVLLRPSTRVEALP